MNGHSLICRFISDNPSDWEEKLTDMGIRVKRGADSLVIFNYGIAADFSNPIVREARGIIIDESRLEVACWPFTKFGNSFESYADTPNMDWKTAKIQEKVDGSLIKLFHHNGSWRWATNSCIDASEATVQTTSESFADIIRQASNYDDIRWDAVDADKTYMFELVSPKTQVVVMYPETRLYHTGTRSNSTGEEYDPIETDIGIQHPRLFGIGGALDGWLKEVQRLNGDGNGECTDEGYVIVDADWHRVKVKSPRYLELHHAISNGVLKKADAIDILMSNDEERRELVCHSPRFEKAMNEYAKRLDDYATAVEDQVRQARDFWSEVSPDRKAFALRATTTDYPKYWFMAIDTDLDAHGMMTRLGAAKVANDIAEVEIDYAAESFGVDISGADGGNIGNGSIGSYSSVSSSDGMVWVDAHVRGNTKVRGYWRHAPRKSR